MGLLKKLFGRRDETPPKPAPAPTARVTARRSHRVAQTSRPAPSAPTPVAQRTTVWRDEYLEGEREAAALARREGAFPNLRLVKERGRLVLEAPGMGWINPRSRALYKIGIYMFGLRGRAYHEATFVAAALPLGRVLELVREPENAHDKNAVAIHARNGKIGYVNKQNAARIAKRIDAGETMRCIVAKGGRAGDPDKSCALLVTSDVTLAHIAQDVS
ncbi:HIRAN domain-containing protein [Cellulosimicrobium sp. ES-005]|uniref:HIRAN domain-containing protein n=1 Tax=Cellulosimicrobium sp. ES-005 TaxID=3163031 RepID=A0AAU8G355_9MICO